jgi:hypothetical protein
VTHITSRDADADGGTVKTTFSIREGDSGLSMLCSTALDHQSDDPHSMCCAKSPAPWSSHPEHRQLHRSPIQFPAANRWTLSLINTQARGDFCRRFALLGEAKVCRVPALARIRSNTIPHRTVGPGELQITFSASHAHDLHAPPRGSCGQAIHVRLIHEGAYVMSLCAVQAVTEWFVAGCVPDPFTTPSSGWMTASTKSFG